MHHFQVTTLVTSAFGPPHPMMDVLTYLLLDELPAMGTVTFLGFPQVEQLLFLLQVILHLAIGPFFKVHFPLWVVRIGFSLDFDVASDRGVGGWKQTYHFRLSLSVLDSPAKDPVALADNLEVFLLDPARTFIRMPSLRPAPKRFVSDIVRIGVGVFAALVTMVVCPAPNDRVQLHHYGPSCGA
jgi:hypothetical protein